MASVTEEQREVWQPERGRYGQRDLIALAFWTVAIVFFFWDVVSLQKALFYFDITEINYPYRDFFARELRAGRFSRWFPGLYCGFPLYSESQAGYFHPLKYLLYPWLATWQAFNLDTVLSIWLTGAGTYGWLRRHVGAAGALTGAAIFGVGGFTWAHFVHTSMINALSSVPLIIWALESGWDRRRFWPIALGALAMASQVFAGHLQDTILTIGLVGLYTLYRTATQNTLAGRLTTLGLATGLVGLGIGLAAVQWVPSKELLDRSPRAGGLTWDKLTYGSWHPELLPTLVVREAYGTRARDTDWMDGFYPYHEMDSYLGLMGLGLAVVGAAAYRDRWVAFWALLAIFSGLLMLGKFTFLFDFAHRIPVFGSSRIPVRYHLWFSMAIAALAAVGVDRLARPGGVSLRAAGATALTLVILSIPILIYVYAPVWSSHERWTLPYHQNRYRWLGNEVLYASARTAFLAASAWMIAKFAARSSASSLRVRLAAILPVLVTVDLLGAHAVDVATITPSYWTKPPVSAQLLAKDPSFVRLFAIAKRSAAEPGFASEPIDFLPVRDTLDWSLPPVWGLWTSRGETPIIPQRLLSYTDTAKPGQGRYDLEGVTHWVTGFRPSSPAVRYIPAGTAYIIKNTSALPRARLVGRPVYVKDQPAAIKALQEMGATVRERLVVEDPQKPLPSEATVSGTAKVVREEPEEVVIETESSGPAYLVLSDTFDPGWSATLDGKVTTIHPAYIAFRAVYVPAGRHSIIFRYRPAGFDLGLTITGISALFTLGLMVFLGPIPALNPEHEPVNWPRWLRLGGSLVVILIVAGSWFGVDSRGNFAFQSRWQGSFHRFTWGSGIEAMRQMPPAGDVPATSP